MKSTLTASMIVLSSLCLAGRAQEGTKVDLQTQAKRIDFTAANFTRPFKMGTSLPASCTLGDLFFKSNAPAGANLFGCVATDVWTNQGGGGGSSLPPQAGAGGGLLTTDGSTVSWVNLGGDVSGAPGSVLVRALQNQPVSVTVPAAGQSLVWDGTAWRPQAVAGQSVLLQVDGVTIGSEPVENFLSGAGIVNTIADTGTQLTIQHTADTAVLLTLVDEQSGAPLLCASLSGSATAYTCSMNPVLTAYTTGMIVHWKPDMNAAGGAMTLDIDTLGAKPVKLADGVNVPTSADVTAGSLYDLWYDGAGFRLRAPVAIAVATARPTCTAALRGRIWHTAAGPGIEDELAVCAKNALDTYAWQLLY